MKSLRLLIRLKPQWKTNSSWCEIWGELWNSNDSYFLRQQIKAAIEGEKKLKNLLSSAGETNQETSLTAGNQKEE